MKKRERESDRERGKKKVKKNQRKKRISFGRAFKLFVKTRNQAKYVMVSGNKYACRKGHSLA